MSTNALAAIYVTEINLDDRSQPRYRRMRRPPRPPFTFTGQHFRQWRDTLVARLHDAAQVRGVSYAEMAQHSRLAALVSN